MDGTTPRRGFGGGRHRPRGRAVSPAARQEVLATIAGLELRPDLLIEHLHRIQDGFGALRAAHLVALADVLRLAPVEVFEVASFYAHFDILEDDAPALPPRTIRVCGGLPCAMAGSAALLEALRNAPPRDTRVVEAPCMGACHRAPAAAVGHELVERATSGSLAAALSGGVAHPPLPGLAEYRARGGYALLSFARSGALTPDAMLAALERAGLRGLGGAGFPAARKWRLVMAHPAPRHLVVNADEGEPGTFKDRHCLEADPHRVLEGMLLAAQAIAAESCWIYLRDEYPHLREALEHALADLRAAGIAWLPIHLRRGAGAYICGEETALLESLEGRRGYPRHKPPFPGEVGLFGRPTLMHNVETLWWLPDILRGPERFAEAGLRGRSGKRLFSVSGRVRDPGVKEAPAGITVRELIAEHCGGMALGHRFVAYLPGGASGGILPESLADEPLDFGTLEQHGCFIGSAAIVVLSDQDELAEAARNLLRFFRDESCGQCTPCRVGTAKATTLLNAEKWDRPLLDELATAMADGSICGLGQAAMNPVRSLLKFFPDVVP